MQNKFSKRVFYVKYTDSLVSVYSSSEVVASFVDESLSLSVLLLELSELLRFRLLPLQLLFWLLKLDELDSSLDKRFGFFFALGSANKKVKMTS